MRISDWSSDVCSSDLLFKESGDVVFAIYLGMLLASVALLMVGMFGQRIFSLAVLVRKSVLLPIIVFLCVVGAYLEGGGMFSVYLMIGFGLVGYFMKTLDYSFVPFLVGYVLGPMAERSEERRVGKECVRRCRFGGSP